VTRRRDDDPDADTRLPLGVLPATNGEYVPDPPSQHDHDVARAALAHADDAARTAGMDRRRFLQTAGGVAAVLATIDLAACSSSASRAAPPTSSTARTTTSRPGGSYTVPPTHEVVACEQALGGNGQFVVDVHTHHVMPDGPWTKNAPETVQLVLGMVPDCNAANQLECASRAAYLHDLFLTSDTTVAMLSDVPNSGSDDAPVPWADQLGTQQFAAQLTHGGAPRVLVHNVIAPNFGDLNARLAEMEVNAKTGKVAAFKVYTAWGPRNQGYAIDDPRIGFPVIEHARRLGVKIICAHKGLPIQGFDQRFNGPADVVAAARQYPDMQFIVYHSAFERETIESVYSPSAAARGVNSFVKAMLDNGLPPNSNVWADLGTTWRELMRKPNEAAHCVGKLLNYIGEDRVLWGTDAIWYGSPQPQIMAFRAFQITPEYQERFGYPALTDAIKRKVFGLNAAKLFGIDVNATRCALDADKLATSKLEFASLVDTQRLSAPWQPRGPLSRRDVFAFMRNGGRIGAG
jgi:predicted TIM-barrel fold metal-dependent hydrolase